MNAAPDFTWLFIRMMAGLILVLGLAIVLIRFVLPRTRLTRMRGKGWVTVVDRFSVGRDSHLMLVKIAEKYLVLGAAGSSVNLITELSKSEGEKLEGG